MKLSTRSRYGTRLMLELGILYGQGPVYLKNIARLENISEKYLSQIVIPLKNSGLVNSFRGAYGGYTLSCEPKDITIRSIVEILEGDFNLAGNNDEQSERLSPSIAVTRKIWKKLDNCIASILDKVSLQDLIEDYNSRQDKPIIYNI